jgi:tRNA1Val (adenine37-N6)-methyltransferase
MKKEKLHGPSLIRDGETADDILGGRIKVIQKKRGYRFSVDALLLAKFSKEAKGHRILDLGTGSGVIALILSHMKPASHVIGIEIQEDLTDMAQRTLALNGCIPENIEIRKGDIRRVETLIRPRSFDAVVFNPPYRRLQSGRINPEEEKARARHEILGSLDDFLKAAACALRPRGRVYLIYPARRMVELICRMRQNRLEPKRCRMVHSYPEHRGEFILAEGISGGREEMIVEPPLYIYDKEGHYSEAMAAVFDDLAVPL